MSFNFGTTAPSTGTPSTGFGFGTGTTTTTTPSTGFSFGTGTPSTTTPSTGFSFGTGTTPNFGTAPSTNAFGTTNPPTLGTLSAPLTRQDTTGPGFSSNSFSFTPSLAPSTPSLFSSAPSLSTGAPSLAPQWAPTQAKQTLTPQQRIMSIANAYNYSGDSPECRFRHMLYNKVPESEVGKYVKPPNVNDRLWTLAVEANPDPKKLVPVQATGFGELQQRISEQDKATEDHQKVLDQIQNFVTILQRKRDLDTTIKMEQYKRRHMELSHRLLKVMKKIEVLRSKGYSLSIEEDYFRSKLASLQRELNQPNLFKGRLNELSALVRMQEDRPSVTYESVDEESLEKIHKFLADQTAALSHLVSVVKKDLKDLSTITEGLSEKAKTEAF